jgi:hypothetical protein
MPRRSLIFAILALGVLAGLLMGRSPWRRWRESVQIKSEVEWIQKATRQLQQVGTPPIEVIQGAVTGRWATEKWLIFTNGWAGYAMHSWHENDGMDDIALLRTSEGSFYLSRCHLCCGITSELRPSDGETTRPADAKDFIERRARRQEWTLFSPDGCLRCAVRSPYAYHKRPSKGIWVWIGSAVGTNETTLLQRRYVVSGTDVSWDTRWVSTNELAVDVFDYGPNRSLHTYEYPPRRDITTLTFCRDDQTGRLVEKQQEVR